MATILEEKTPYQQSVELLLKLHALMREGKGESAQADSLREASEEPWWQLSEEQKDRVRSLSADLDTIGVDRTVADSVPDLDMTKISAAVASENWADALEILRESEDRLPPAEVAFVRGTCWANLGEPHVAIEFLREASRLEPPDAMKEVWLLTSLVQAGRAADAIERARVILQESESPLLLLQAATVMSARANEVDDTREVESLRRDAIAAANKGMQHVDAVTSDDKPTLEAMLVGSYLHLAMNHDELGDTNKAREACAAALRLAPNHIDALMLQGWLNRDADPAAASADFHKGLGQRLTAQPAFAFLTTTSNVLGN